MSPENAAAYQLCETNLRRAGERLLTTLRAYADKQATDVDVLRATRAHDVCQCDLIELADEIHSAEALNRPRLRAIQGGNQCR